MLTGEHETAADLVAAWDRGETIWSVSMGGLGPGYEQAIQVMAVEFARAGIGSTLPDGDDEQKSDAWRAICDQVMQRIDSQIGGASGAQYGAASWLSYQWVHGGGPADLMRRCRERDAERAIQVSSHFPKVRP